MSTSTDRRVCCQHRRSAARRSRRSRHPSSASSFRLQRAGQFPRSSTCSRPAPDVPGSSSSSTTILRRHVRGGKRIAATTTHSLHSTRRTPRLAALVWKASWRASSYVAVMDATAARRNAAAADAAAVAPRRRNMVSEPLRRRRIGRALSSRRAFGSRLATSLAHHLFRLELSDP